jgi:hypothetical protein
MQRQLLLAGPERGHPIRQQLRRAEAIARKRREDEDLKLFALSFVAFFVCFYTFLA